MKRVKTIGIKSLNNRPSASVSIYECVDCGNHFEWYDYDVKTNRKRNCGCVRSTKSRNINHPSFISHVGVIKGRALGLFKCDHCDNTVQANISDIKSGRKRTINCGNHKRQKPIKIKCKYLTLADRISIRLNITHQEAKRILFTHRNMKRRCLSMSHPKYKDYGGRGISICDNWINNPMQFAIDMGAKPFRGATLDRINNDGDYEPNNCRWATQLTQQNNKRTRRGSSLANI